MNPLAARPLLLLASALLAAGGALGAIGISRPRVGPVSVRVVNEAGVGITATVVTRCWHAEHEPPFTDVRSNTSADGVVQIAEPRCAAIDVAAEAPGHLPSKASHGGGGPVELTLRQAPPAAGPQLRDAGFRGRTAPGATLVLESRDGRVTRIIGWDLLGDKPATERERADVWLTSRQDEDTKQLMHTTLLPGAGAALGLVKAEEPVLWHVLEVPDELGDDPVRPAPAPGKAIVVRARDGRTTALLLLDRPEERTEGCLNGHPGCIVQRWTMAVVLQPDGSGRLAHGLRPDLTALLGEVDPLRLARRVPLARLVIDAEGAR
jgi:hypothetical protein